VSDSSPLIGEITRGPIEVLIIALAVLSIVIASLLAAVIMLVLRHLERAWDDRRRRRSRRYWR
jgi:hypothetical protein